MFCVECGTEGEIYKNGVCINCYIKNKTFTKGPLILDIFSCSNCSSYKYKNTWIDESFENTLERHIRDNFQISNELKNTKIKTYCDEKDKNLSCKLIISGNLNNHQIEEEHTLQVRLKTVVCDVCSKQFGGYYEAILQIRADKKLYKNELKKIKSYIEDFVSELHTKGNRGLFITDFGEESGGIDFYLSEKGPAYTIAKKVQEKYGGEIKQSSSNIGMKDSRQIYRMTFLVRLPPYRSGNFIYFNKSFYYITKISGNKIHVIEMKTLNSLIFDEKQLQNLKILGGKELIKEMILVSQSNNDLQVMDIKSYQTYEIKKPMRKNIQSDMVKVVNLGDRFFLMPEKIIIDK
jgi:nonsense-mediated mRNA decay protein 3